MRTDVANENRELLEENIKLSKEILAVTKKTHRYMRWAQILATLRLVIFIIPFILAFIYLPPFLSKISESFGNLYGGGQFNILNQLKSLNGGGLDIGALLKQLQNSGQLPKDIKSPSQK